MRYRAQLRETVKAFLQEWNIAGVVSLLSFPTFVMLGLTTEAERMVVVLFGYQFVTDIEWPALVDLTIPVLMAIGTAIIVVVGRALIEWTWQHDRDALRAQLLSDPGRIRPLLGIGSAGHVVKLEEATGMTVWELVLLVNYVQLMETLVRQSTRAPAALLEASVQVDVSTLPGMEYMNPPLTGTEVEILAHELERCADLSLRERAAAWLDPRSTNIVKVLARGITAHDYANGNMHRFGELLRVLCSTIDGVPPLFDEGAVRNLIRLAVKDHDLKVVDRSTDTGGEEVWTVHWDGAHGVVNTHAGSAPVLELSGVTGFSATMMRRPHDNVTGRPVMALVVTGYHVPDAEGHMQPRTLEFLEEFQSTDTMTRRQRLLLEDIFEGEFDGNSIRLVDSSNIALALEGYVRRQHTLHRVSQAVERRLRSCTPEEVDEELACGLLRVNLLPQTRRADTLLDTLNPGATLATAGVVGLLGLDTPQRRRVCALVEAWTGEAVAGNGTMAADNTVTDGDGQKAGGVHRTVDMPQLRGKRLSDTMPTLELAGYGTLGWIATGGGAWIIERDLVGRYASKVSGADIRRMYVFFHHPFREKVLLETMTHQNYHYAWEILHNRVRFLTTFPQDSHEKVQVVWAREAFQPTGNASRLDGPTRKTLDNVTPAVRADPDADFAIMMVRANQTVRTPVNAINMVFLEDSRRLSPVPSTAVDFMLRQRMHEAVAMAFSRGCGLVEDGRPTRLCLSEVWLRPARIGEEPCSVPDFTSHRLSDPRTWVQCGFLDLLVKEVRCAYGLVKTLSTYARGLEAGTELPFKLVQRVPEIGTASDIRDLWITYDIVCDFLEGRGDFSKRGVTAVGEDSGYLMWLEKTLLQLDSVGSALRAPTAFRECRRACLHWLARLASYCEEEGDPLSRVVYRLLERVGQGSGEETD